MKKVWFMLAMFVCTVGLVSCNDENEELVEVEQEVEEEEKISLELKRISFLAKENPQALISDIECSIIGDSVIECLIPHIVESKMLIPTFDNTSLNSFQSIENK